MEKEEFKNEAQRAEEMAKYMANVEKGGKAEVSFPEHEEREAAKKKNQEMLEKARQELKAKLGENKEEGKVIDGKFRKESQG